MPVNLETERLLLRPPKQEDADDFFDIFCDEETCRCDGGYPPFRQKDETFDRTFDGLLEDAENRLFLEEKHSGRMIGVMHLMASGKTDAAEIGYAVHRDFRRRGYASEALKAVLAALTQQGVNDVICTVYQFNHASCAMLEKLGFVCDGLVEHSNPEWNEKIYTLELNA